MVRQEARTPADLEKILKIPTIAWPTILTILTAITVQFNIIFLLHNGSINKYVALLINIIAVYSAFTPMHDACHGSIAKGNYRFLNPLVGHLASLCFPVPFDAFKYLHLQHHTNEDEDPDHWAGSGPTLLLPFRWMTIEFKYYYTFLSNLFKRPEKERYIVLGSIVLLILIIVMLCNSGYSECVLWGWVYPGRIAAMFLAYVFDYLPHRPHEISRYDDQFKATNVTSLVGVKTYLLTWPLFHQNYHNIHHLYPYVPFYYYSTIWHEMKDELMKKGTEIKPVISFN